MPNTTIEKPHELKSIDEMTREELNAKLARGYKQALNGEGRPAKEVFDELRRKRHEQKAV